MISVGLSPCPTFAQAARQSRCASTGRGQGEGHGQHTASDRPPPHRASSEPSRWSEAAHARGQAGREERGENRGRLPRDCALGAGPREEKLAAVTERPIKALGLDSGGKKVLEEMKEQSRLSVCPYRVSHYLFCMTNRHKTIPEQHGASDTTRGTEEGRSPGGGGEAGG